MNATNTALFHTCWLEIANQRCDPPLRTRLTRLNHALVATYLPVPVSSDVSSVALSRIGEAVSGPEPKMPIREGRATIFGEGQEWKNPVTRNSQSEVPSGDTSGGIGKSQVTIG